jgi:hypothetical protein
MNVYDAHGNGCGPKNKLQWNLWKATLENEDILWNKDTSSGPKLLNSVQIAPWKEHTSELGTLLARPKGVVISQVSLYYSRFIILFAARVRATRKVGHVDLLVCGPAI